MHDTLNLKNPPKKFGGTRSMNCQQWKKIYLRQGVGGRFNRANAFKRPVLSAGTL
jgi:hypothetical protein